MRLMKWRRPNEALGWWIFIACLVMYGLSAVISILQAEPGTDWVGFLFEPSSSEAIVDLGIGGVVPWHENAVWSLIAANYLHGNIIHIGMNMLCLLAMTPVVVRQFGRSRTFVIYTLAGIASGLGSIAFDEYYSLGASGCIFGLFGAQIAYGLRVGGREGWQPVKNNALWFVLTLVLGLTSTFGVSNGGHIGGLFGGFATAMAMLAGKQDGQAGVSQKMHTILLAMTGVCLATGIAMAGWSTYLARTDRQAYEKRQQTHAQAFFDKYTAREPDNAAGRYASGIASYDQRNWQAALDDLTAAEKLDPNDYGIRLARANTLYMMERYAESVTAFNLAIIAEPDLIKPRYYRAVALQQLDRQDEALAEYRNITRLEPEEKLEYGQRAAAYAAQGEQDKAIADYDVAIKADPDAANLYDERGTAKYAKGDMEEAVADFSQAIAHAPDVHAYHSHRAAAYYLLQRWDLAITDYDVALKADAEQPSLHLDRGNAYFAKGDMNAAILDFNEAIRQAPPNYAALAIRGIAYGEIGQHQKGLADLNYAIAEGAPDAVAFNGRAWTLFKLNRASEGLPDVERSLELSPDLAAALDTRAHIFESLGQRDKAIADYRAGLEKDPSMEGSREGLRRLGAL